MMQKKVKVHGRNIQNNCIENEKKLKFNDSLGEAEVKSELENLNLLRASTSTNERDSSTSEIARLVESCEIRQSN